MGILGRTRDIVNSNINAMLDKAENPEKLIKMMAHEMAETLARVKAASTGVLAAKREIQDELRRVREQIATWRDRAKMALDKAREDLAREALVEKRRFTERAEGLERQMAEADVLLERYQADIVELEEKLKCVREKERVLVQRHTHAQRKKEAQVRIRRFDTSNVMARFEGLENRIERMEAEADLINFGRKPTVEEELERLRANEEIENELAMLKQSAAG